jgi:hypothetical protein
MWIVRFALQRPYTFVIVALLIAIFSIAESQSYNGVGVIKIHFQPDVQQSGFEPV